MEIAIGKRYKLSSSDNFEEYMKFVGVGYLSRKTAMSVSPVFSLNKNDDGSWTILFTTVIRNVTIKFNLNEEFVEERADGTKVQSKYFFEDGKLLNIQVEKNGRTSRHVREITANKVVLTTTCEGWDGKSVRVYDLIQ